MRIRPYKAGDAEKISLLLDRHTTYQRDSEFWLWINRIWPESSSIVAVAEQDGEIAGHYAILPITLEHRGESIRCGLGVHAFIAPDYRGKVPIFHISKKCYELAKKAGVQMVWGFPNERYRMIQEKVEGWIRVDEFNAWTKITGGETQADLTLKTICQSNPDELRQLNDFLESSPIPCPFGMKPSLPLWLNRFVHHPQNHYHFHFAMDGDEQVAALVTKIHEDGANGSRLGHLVDYSFADISQSARVVSLLEHHFRDQVDQICLWPGNTTLRATLEESGFIPNGFSTFFGLKILDPQLRSITQDLMDPENWNLTMAMSDVF